MLDIFHPIWKLKIAENPKLFSIISQLWQAAYNNDNEYYHEENKATTETTTNSNLTTSPPKTNNDKFPLPFGNFPYNKGFIYLDRIGYRIPTKLSDEIGNNNESKKKKKHPKSLQRSLTPHLDCCPTTIIENNYSNVSKWRPFQSFIALTDTIEPNTGGFEAVPGFHLQFESWARNRKNTITKGKNNTIREKAAPCLGEFTPIRPKEDIDVIKQMKHIPCKAGSFVIWDVRIPHANSLYNTSNNVCRSVVYTSFLPDISINRQYALERQLKLYKEKRKMTDQWIANDVIEDEEDYAFSTLGKFLMGLDDWDRLSDYEIDNLHLCDENI